MAHLVLSSRPFFSPLPLPTSLLTTSPPPYSLCYSFAPFSLSPLSIPFSVNTSNSQLRAAWQPPKCVYPDPIPEFANAETKRFRDELPRKLLKNKETFGDDVDVDAVVEVCTEIFRDFLHKEYGGPGTLIVEPFTDMLLALKEKKLPGAPVAARAALLWAQNYVDGDWDIWTSRSTK